MNGKSLAEVKEIEDRFSTEYWGRDSLNGIGIGIGEDGAYCIKANFENGCGLRRSPMPDEFEGVKVQKTIIGKVIAF